MCLYVSGCFKVLSFTNGNQKLISHWQVKSWNIEKNLFLYKSYLHMYITFVHNHYLHTGTYLLVLQSLVEKRCWQGVLPRVDATLS